LTRPVERPQGTLEMLILKAVSLGPLHGYGILLRIQQISGERLEILQGSFYTAIYRLERQDWIKGEWGESQNNRRAGFYLLTGAGRRQLKAETGKWIDMAAVVAGILNKKADEI
jgi:PadR family transcriptional regulator, regulatory protein PadR